MEDVGRAPEGVSSAFISEVKDAPMVDGWIESLMSCKQLAESDVQKLCEKVRPSTPRYLPLFLPRRALRLHSRSTVADALLHLPSLSPRGIRDG